MAKCAQVDHFKEEFKRYKKHGADLSDVIDLSSLPCKHNKAVESIPINLSNLTLGYQDRARRLGLTSPETWLMYKLTAVPGLYVVPNPFAVGGQHSWVRRCLVDYPCKPNICNLDAHFERTGDGRLWPSPAAIADGAGLAASPSGERKQNEGLKGPAPAKRLKLSKSDLLQKLRWVTLGYHYDWTNKAYSSHNRSPFPADLAELSSFLLEVIGFPRFCAEAAIVNYYHLDSTLSGHTDHSEKDLSQPLLSISFGQSAIFLIGGPTKQTRPHALLLKSGDVVVMSSESRLAYHGVPRILPPSLNHPAVPLHLSLDALQHSMKESDTSGGSREALSFCVYGVDRTKPSTPLVCSDGALKISEGARNCLSCQELAGSWEEFVDYLSMSRINVNIRQVVSEKYGFEDT